MATSKNKVKDLKISELPIDAPFDMTDTAIIMDSPQGIVKSLPQENLSVEQLPTWDELVKRELQKFDEVVPKIDEISKELMALTINGIDDKEGYKKVSEGLRFLVGKRTAVEAKRKQIKAPSNAFGISCDDRAKEITAMLAPIEENLRTKKEKIDAELEIIEQKKEEAKLVKIKDRHDKLVSIGMNLVAGEYLWNSKIDLLQAESLPEAALKSFIDSDFDAYIAVVSNLIKNEEAAFEIIRKEEQEEVKRVAEAKKQLEEEQNKLIEDQQKMKREMDDFKRQRANVRMELLKAIGLKKSDMTGMIFYENVSIISSPELLEMTIEDWDVKLEEIKERVIKIQQEAEIKKAQEEQKKKLDAIQLTGRARVSTLQAIGVINQSVDTLGVMPDEEWSKCFETHKLAYDEKKKAELLKKQQEDKEAAEKLEKERTAALSDKQKITEYAQKLLAVDKPEVKTAKWVKTLKDLVDNIELYI